MTRRRHLLVLALLLFVVACGSQLETGQGQDVTPTFPPAPDQLPDDVEQPDVVIPTPPVAERSQFRPLTLDDPRLETQFPVTLVARPDGSPFAGEFRGRARVERNESAILASAGDVVVALQLPESLQPPDLDEEVELAVSYFDDPTETGGANHTVELLQGDIVVAAAVWRTGPEPITVELAGLKFVQEGVEPSRDSEYTPAPTSVNGEVQLDLAEPQRFDETIIVTNRSHRFVAADDVETFGTSYILRLWLTSAGPG